MAAKRASLLALSALLILAGCGKKAEKAEPKADLGTPQIATSLEEMGLPVDRSAQMTAIDATIGDASGMPRDSRSGEAERREAKAIAVEAEAPAPETIAPPEETPTTETPSGE